MSADAATELFGRLGDRAGLPRPVTAHMLRHGFASSLADSGATVDEIAELLGHYRLSSSDRYLRPAGQRLREAVDRVAAPASLLAGAR